MLTFARLGYAAKGVVYALIGGLALQLAFGRGGDLTGSRGALAHLAEAPFGKVLLFGIAVGMLGLVAWRLAQSLGNVERRPHDAKGTLARIGLFGTGVFYAALAAAAVRFAIGSGGSGGDQTQSASARLMSLPFGRWLVAAVGVGLVGYAIAATVGAVKKKFMQRLSLHGVAARNAQKIIRICQFGIIARAAVFGLMGVFFLQSAVRFDPSEAKGFGETLGEIAQQPYGTVLLAICAAGLLAYAVSAFVEGRYRRFDTSAPHHAPSNLRRGFALH